MHTTIKYCIMDFPRRDCPFLSFNPAAIFAVTTSCNLLADYPLRHLLMQVVFVELLTFRKSVFQMIKRHYCVPRFRAIALEVSNPDAPTLVSWHVNNVPCRVSTGTGEPMMKRIFETWGRQPDPMRDSKH